MSVQFRALKPFIIWDLKYVGSIQLKLTIKNPSLFSLYCEMWKITVFVILKWLNNSLPIYISRFQILNPFKFVIYKIKNCIELTHHCSGINRYWDLITTIVLLVYYVFLFLSFSLSLCSLSFSLFFLLFLCLMCSQVCRK